MHSLNNISEHLQRDSEKGMEQINWSLDSESLKLEGLLTLAKEKVTALQPRPTLKLFTLCTTHTHTTHNTETHFTGPCDREVFPCEERLFAILSSLCGRTLEQASLSMFSIKIQEVRLFSPLRSISLFSTQACDFFFFIFPGPLILMNVMGTEELYA